MRMLVLSDSHGNYPLALKAIEKAGRVDRIVHLGDGIEDARIIEEIVGFPIIKVPGNCDLSAPEPRELLTVSGGVRILATHGDAYHVKSGLTALHRRAVSQEARVVLYGHTHIALAEEMEGILFVNPGCLRYRWPDPSCAVVTLRPGKASALILPVE